MSPAQVHVISHTHWDREWYLTFEQYRARLVDLVDGVLDRMAADPRLRSSIWMVRQSWSRITWKCGRSARKKYGDASAKADS